MNQNISCRLCLTVQVNLLNIFEQREDGNIAALLTKHFWFKIQQDDAEKYVCTICWSKVEDFHSFYTKVYNRHEELAPKDRNIIKEHLEVKKGTGRLDNMAPVSELKLANFKRDIEMEGRCGDNASKIDLACKLNNAIHIECSETTHLTTHLDKKPDCLKMEPPDVLSYHSILDSDARMPDIQTKHINISEKSGAHLENECDSHNKDQLDILFDHNSSGSYDNDYLSRSQTSKEDVQGSNTGNTSEANNEANKIIMEYFTMECEVCPSRFDTFLKFQLHYRKEHSMQGYLRCCDKKFTKQASLIDHIKGHLHPGGNYKCDQCTTTFAHKHSLRRHYKRHLSSWKKAFKCNQCPKRYTTKSSLAIHLTTHNNEKNYKCDECDKSFHNEMSLQMHKTIHDRDKIYLCDVCAKEFRSKLVFEDHQKRVHQNIPMSKFQCPICGVWLKQYYVKKHMDIHEDSKVDYCCSICGKKSLNRRALNKHTRTVHSDKVYRCSICEKSFKKQISLKEHMSSHTGIALYTCPYCAKTFNSSANMYSHKKKMHVKEWEQNERLKATGAL